MSATKTKTIASLMYDYAVKQIYSVSDLREEMVKVVDSIKEQGKDKNDPDAFVRKALAAAANEKLGGKTPLFMLLSTEAALGIAAQEAPEATFTYYALNQVAGIWVLYNVLGNSVDTSICDNFGYNVTAACRVSYQMHGAEILEFICTLWPETSTKAEADRNRVMDTINGMETENRMRSIKKLMNEVAGSNTMHLTDESVREFMEADETPILTQIFDLEMMGKTRPMTQARQLRFDQATQLVQPELDDFMFEAYNVKNARDAK